MSTHLYRSRDDRMLAGVAGGLADLWDADPSLVRIIWAVLVPLTGGMALLVYIVMAIVVPEEETGRSWGSDMVGWTAWNGSRPAGSGTPPAGAPSTAGAAQTGTTGPDASPDPAATAGAQPTPAAGSGFAPPPWPASRFEAREMRRAARHEARAARRAARGHEGRTGGLIIGILFILVGVWSLLRAYLPTIDWDWFWPLVLVGVGVLVLFLAIRPRDDEDGPGAS